MERLLNSLCCIIFMSWFTKVVQYTVHATLLMANYRSKRNILQGRTRGNRQFVGYEAVIEDLAIWLHATQSSRTRCSSTLRTTQTNEKLSRDLIVVKPRVITATTIFFPHLWQNGWCSQQWAWQSLTSDRPRAHSDILAGTLKTIHNFHRDIHQCPLHKIC